MPRSRNTIPTVRLHKPSGHAYPDYRCPVTDRHKSVSLGRWGSPEAIAEHARMLAELASASRPCPPAPPCPSCAWRT